MTIQVQPFAPFVSGFRSKGTSHVQFVARFFGSIIHCQQSIGWAQLSQDRDKCAAKGELGLCSANAQNLSEENKLIPPSLSPHPIPELSYCIYGILLFPLSISSEGELLCLGKLVCKVARGGGDTNSFNSMCVFLWIFLRILCSGLNWKYTENTDKL